MNQKENLEKSNRRFVIDCREAGKGCSLTIGGNYDEVLETGVLHAKSKHGMAGDDATVRQALKSFIKEEVSDVPPRQTRGTGLWGSSSSQRPPSA